MAKRTKTDAQINKQAEKTRAKRMRWWHDARFGMFVHWGLYSQLARHEWVMNRERIPLAEYEKLVDSFKPRPRPMRQWAKLARDAGMKYMVMTTKHHEGFCLWDSQQTDYCAGKRGPRRDLVAEYVDACHEFGLKIGFYYSLMDWHHPDGVACANDAKARRRFLDYTQGCVRELMSNYGKVDVLWYDVPWPLKDAKAWESARMNAMVRRLQPHILVNNRSRLPEDFGTPEGHVKAEDGGRAWEACMTFNESWGWVDAPDEDWLPARKVLHLIRQVTAGGGNLLLNIGPLGDGSVPEQAIGRLKDVGKWMKTYGDEVVYGKVDRCDGLFEWFATGTWTRRSNTAYFWCHWGWGKTFAIGGLATKVKRVTVLPGGLPVKFTQTADRLILEGLPAKCPDRTTGIGVLKIEFSGTPRQQLGPGCVLLK